MNISVRDYFKWKAVKPYWHCWVGHHLTERAILDGRLEDVDSVLTRYLLRTLPPVISNLFEQFISSESLDDFIANNQPLDNNIGLLDSLERFR